MTRRQSPAEAAKQLRAFVGKFDAKQQALIRAARRAIRKRLPAWNELVYDNYNFFVIAYCPTERPSDAVLSIAAGAGGVNLFFLQGRNLPDPAHLLQGAGNQTRFIRIASARELAGPEVSALIDAAVARSKPDAQPKGRLIIRSVSATQRPRKGR